MDVKNEEEGEWGGENAGYREAAYGYIVLGMVE